MLQSMIQGPAYPAARFVADKLHGHFETHAANFSSAAASPGPIPNTEAIECIIDAAFWTSLRREEQHPPRISLAYVPPERATPALLFERPLALSPGSLTRVAPGVERPGIHLCVWKIDGEYKVWGATQALPPLCFVVETVAPGLLVVKHRWSEESAKFVNIAVLEGDQVKILDNRFSTLPGCPSILSSLLGFDFTTPSTSGSSSVLIRLALSMRAHGRGGALLVVPPKQDNWRESISHPLLYSVVPPYNELSEVVKEAPDMKQKRRWRDALSRSVDAVAGLTAIDGATIINNEFEVLAFGSKILRRRGSSPVEEVAVVEPTEGSAPQLVHPAQLGGTRHLSAAQFAYDQREALAFVASQDGPFTIFSWADCEDRLYAYRVESLLL